MERKNNKFVYFAAASVNLMSMVSAIGFAWTSPCIPKLNGSVDPQNNPLPLPTTVLEESWITSLHSVGAACCPLFIVLFTNKYGRKKTLIIFSLPMMASNIILIFANAVWHIYVARFLIGLGTGCVFSIIPLYVAEISNVENRGFTSLFLALMNTSQQFLVFIIGPYVTISSLAMISLIPSVLFLLFFGLLVPESPYYFVMNNKKEEAEKSLAKFRQKPKSHIQEELLLIIESVEQSKTKKSLKKIIKSKNVGKCLFLVSGLMFFQQFTGNLAITPYLQSIFDATHTSIPGDKSVMIVGLVQLITTVITSRIIDRVDRKILLIASNIGILLSLIFLGTYFFLLVNKFNVKAVFWLPICSIMFFMVCFNFGIGPIPWTIAGEIYPPKLKTHLNGITTFFNIFLGFLITIFFPTISLVLGMAWSIWVFAFFTAVSLIFIGYFLPETRGKTFLEIQLMLREAEEKN